MKIKVIKVIAIMAVTITFSGVELLCGGLGFNETAAYAASSLNDIRVETSGGSDVSLYENDNYTKEIDNTKSIKDTYYAKLPSDDSKIAFNTSGSNGIVKIFKDHSSKVYNEGDYVPVLTGKTTFHIRIYDTYDENQPNKYIEDYRVIIKKYTSEEEKEIINDNQGAIYLQTLQLDYGDIPLGFDKNKSTYSAKVDSDVKSIAIKAEPEDGATTVKINNITVDENDGYKKMVNLNPGNNAIEIRLSQSYEKDRIYTVNINRLESSNKDSNNSGSTTNNTAGNNAAVDKNNENNVADTKSPNKWIKVSDKWRYNDSYGNPIKNNWFFDRNYSKNYYFDSDGNMVTGWLNLNNNWYHLNNNGAMETGWVYVNTNWYYLDYDGKMKTGWFKDCDGRYYYLEPSTGAMAHNTIIGGYELGSNGAWKSKL